MSRVHPRVSASLAEAAEALTPRVFRAIVYTLEFIERRKTTLDYAFRQALLKVALESGEIRHSYILARHALLAIGASKYLVRLHGLERAPLRRRAAFYAALPLALHVPEGLGRVISARGGLLTNRMVGILRKVSADSLERAAEDLPAHDALSLKYSIPPLLSRRLVELLGEKEAEKLARSLHRRFVWVRAAAPERGGELEQYLRARGLKARRDPEVSYLFELDVPEDEPLPEIPSSLGVYQDKASVLVAEALVEKVEEGGFVVDAAAAPCLKTQLFAALRAGVTVLAVDISLRRLTSCREFVGSYAAVHLIQADSRFFRVSREASAALVDAPCTNSGAIGGDPGLRLALWGLTPQALESLQETQVRMLRSSLENLRLRGFVVYSTCSLFPEEGEEVVQSLLGRVILASPRSFKLSPGYSKFPFSCCVSRAFPHVHRTEGFFIAVMQKVR
uniref:RsmB/NOP family class I SAM-dependent RNA methyltransferase n=1 Tax=Thermofilum pendens TaxID=2269 RepID=A0A7J3X8L9_THEPE